MTPDHFATIRKTLSHLRVQTAAERIEIVIVAPSRETLGLEESLLREFAGYAVVEHGPITSVGEANAAGVRRAAAPVVALAEEHCFPDPRWAENLIRAHQGSWAAVGPAVRNANPATAVSWADLFIGYGPWLAPVTAGEVEFLPGHNTSYKREVLLGYGGRLEAVMAAETLLHWDLRAKGLRLYLEPAATVAHANFSLWSSFIPVQYFNGRLFAGQRARTMAPVRRAAYLAGSPLIPLVRLGRIARAARSPGLRYCLLRCLPVLIVGLVLDALGQAVGYALGPGEAPRQIARREFHRSRHVTAGDRSKLFEP